MTHLMLLLRSQGYYVDKPANIEEHKAAQVSHGFIISELFTLQQLTAFRCVLWYSYQFAFVLSECQL
jgi:hypothetical protein